MDFLLIFSYLLVFWPSQGITAPHFVERTLDILFDCYHIESTDLQVPITDINYDITFHPYFLEFVVNPTSKINANKKWNRIREPTFYTRVRVAFTLTKPIYRLSLHAAPRSQYILLLAKVNSLGNTSLTQEEFPLPHNQESSYSSREPPLAIVSLQLCEEQSLLTVHFNREVKEKERIQLDMTVLGNITTPPFDLEFSQNAAKLMIVTEPIFMRRVFPCFDEPHYRGYFTLQVLRQKGLFSLSNMPRSAVLPVKMGVLLGDLGACRLDEYNLLPITFTDEVFECDRYPATEYSMSTYLFSVYVGTQQIRKSDLMMRPDLTLELYYSDKDTNEANAKLFLNHTSLYINFFEDYFNARFPGNVMHSVIVNLSLGVGAETWNIVGYQSAFTSMDSKQTIAHEVIHHWIGNLVSISSWKYLWVKESTTEMLTRLYGCGPHFQWPVADTDHFLGVLQLAFLDDVFHLSNPPIEWALCSKGDMEDVFSWRIYDKGALIIYILQETILENETILRSALQKMIHFKSEKSLSGSDFWEFFNTTEVDLPANLSEIMNPFMQHRRFPVVFLTAHPNKYSNFTYTLTIHFDTFRLFPEQPEEETAWKYLKVKVYSNDECLFNGWLTVHTPVIISNEFNFTNVTLTANKHEISGWHATHYPWQVYEKTIFLSEGFEMGSSLEIMTLIISGYERNLTTIMRLMTKAMEREIICAYTDEDPYPVWPARAFTIHPFLINESISSRFEQYFNDHSRNYTELENVYNNFTMYNKKTLNGISFDAIGTFRVRESPWNRNKFQKPNLLSHSSISGCKWYDLHRLSNSRQEEIISTLFHHLDNVKQTEFLKCYLESLRELMYSTNKSLPSFKDIFKENKTDTPDWLLVYLLENIHTIHMTRRAVNDLLVSYEKQKSPTAGIETLEFQPTLVKKSVHLLHVLYFTDRINFLAGEPWCSFMNNVYEVLLEEPRLTDEFFTLKLKKNIHVITELALAACNLHKLHGISTSDWLSHQGY